MSINQALETIVVLCAGGGKRFMRGETNKLHARIAGKPLLYHAMSPWIRPERKWVLVASPSDDEIAPLAETLGINAHVVLQPEPLGITDAILRAAPAAGPFFTVILGDCVMNGNFDFSVAGECGAAVWRGGAADDVRDNYGVETGDGLITKAVEKPSDPTGLLCGMGVYFFNPELTEFCRSALSAGRGDAHITSILNRWVIDEGNILSPVWFDGDYVNVNTIDVLHRAESIVNNRENHTFRY